MAQPEIFDAVVDEVIDEVVDEVVDEGIKLVKVDDTVLPVKEDTDQKIISKDSDES